MKPFAFFDLGNVLVNFDHRIAVAQLAELSEQPSQRVKQVVFDSGLQDQFETGLIGADQYCSTINQALACRLSEDQILEAVSAIFEFNQPILGPLRLLREHRVPMAVLSNTCSAHWEWILRQDWPIPADWFEFAVLSYEVQSMKPDSKIYAVCEAQSRTTGTAVFFTDDRKDNIEAAARRSWTTHQFSCADNLMAALENWLQLHG